ncbi:MAG: DUF4129 domain-containing protein [Pirellulaceae bacterium]|nr:DUF4129 domain-containing protein [Pirellulaceae bacterium]
MTKPRTPSSTASKANVVRAQPTTRQQSSTEESRLRPTAVDTIIAALAPGLIIGMICCLVFFLIIVVCRGDFTVRLMYILGLYTFASVLVARIAIEQSRAISMAYTSALGVATLLVALQFVAFSGALSLFAFPILVGFLILIGFLADRITFDCTLIDESDDSSGVGLLQSLGVVKNPQASPTATHHKPRHNPGVWVLYFSLLAIPLFGLGQLTIPASEPDSLRSAYWFLFGYLFFSMCVLVLTSYLGLRRYLRQRKVETPIQLNAIWMFGGFVGVLAVLLIVGLLPLPSGSQGVFDLPIRFEATTKIQSSRFGWGSEGKKESTSNAKKITQEDPESKSDSTSTTSENSKSKEKGSSDKNKKNTSAEKSQKSSQKNEKSETATSSNKKSTSKVEKPSDSKVNDNDTAKEPSGKEAAEKKDNELKNDIRKEDKSESNRRQTKSEQASTTWSISLAGGLSNLLRWIVSALLVMVVIYLVMHYRAELRLAIQSLGDWWRGLFGNADEEPKVDEIETSSQPLLLAALKPFSDFANPFASRGQGWNAGKIVRHTFDAIEVWGRERQLVRSSQETPEEFLRRLAAQYPEQSESMQRLTQLYNRLAYAQSTIDANEARRLSTLWSWLKTNR